MLKVTESQWAAAAVCSQVWAAAAYLDRSDGWFPHGMAVVFVLVVIFGKVR